MGRNEQQKTAKKACHMELVAMKACLMCSQGQQSETHRKQLRPVTFCRQDQQLALWPRLGPVWSHASCIHTFGKLLQFQSPAGRSCWLHSSLPAKSLGGQAILFPPHWKSLRKPNHCKSSAASQGLNSQSQSGFGPLAWPLVPLLCKRQQCGNCSPWGLWPSQW